MRQLDDDALQNSTASFYDVNANINHKFNDKNNLYVSGYFSKDKFRLDGDTTYSYSDRNASIKWKHIFNNKFYGILTGGFSKYSYAIESDANPVNAFTMKFSVQQLNAKADFNYFLNSKHTITGGLSSIYYTLSPGNLQPRGTESLVTPDVLQDEQGLESAVYVGDNFEVRSETFPLCRSKIFFLSIPRAKRRLRLHSWCSKRRVDYTGYHAIWFGQIHCFI